MLEAEPISTEPQQALYAPEAPAGTLATLNVAKNAGRAPSPVAVIVPEPVMNITSVADIGIETGCIVAGETIQTVNARKLHGFLEVGKDFSNWTKDRIAGYNFIIGIDFKTAEVLSTPNLASAKARQQKLIE